MILKAKDSMTLGQQVPQSEAFFRGELIACPSNSMFSYMNLGDKCSTSGRHIAWCYLRGNLSNWASSRKYGGFLKR